MPKLIIPDSVTNFNSSAIHDCCDLQNIKVGKGLKYINFGTFASERTGYVDLPYEAEFISTSNMWGGTTLLVASNSFALEFAKAYNIPYQINKEGPKPVESKPQPKPTASSKAESQESVPSVVAPVESIVTPTDAPTDTPTDTPTDRSGVGGGWIWFVVGGVALLAVSGAGWLFIKKKKS